MKPIGQHEPEDSALDRLLKEWRVNASLPPRFQERVWDRIALEEAARPGAGRQSWLGILGRLQAFLARPSLAAGYVMVLLGIGFAFGWSRGLEKSAQLDQALGAQYVRVIDPYQALLQP